ncbi:MAG: diguanylate cyclase [Cyanobacteria bacterium]|nr:diguanylate cyclase [Cyanobacteriota bacterium]
MSATSEGKGLNQSNRSKDLSKDPAKDSGVWTPGAREVIEYTSEYQAKEEQSFKLIGTAGEAYNAIQKPTMDTNLIIKQLDYYRSKAIQQDIIIFEMRALLQSGKGLSNILNLKQLLDTFMAVVREKYSAVNTTVLLKDDLDHSKEYFRVKSYYGLNDTFCDEETGLEESMYMYKLPKNNGLLWQLIQQGNVFSVRDMQREPRFAHAWKHWNLDVLQSDIWCPLIKSGEVLGILTIGEREDGTQISEDDYAFIQELASIAITNIDSTLKYEKNERILKNIQTLYDINQQIANVNDFKHLCIQTLSKAVDVLMTQKGNLMIFNKQTQKLEIRVVWGNIPIHVRDEINNGLIETKTFALGEGIAGECAKTKKPIRMNDRSQIPQVGQHEVYCIASVPIIYGNELEGVINMTNKVMIDAEGNTVLDPLGRFTEEDIALLLGLADQAAVNLHKTRLYSASITDRMTGLYNTRFFEQMLAEKFSDSLNSHKPLILAISDIDHFKKFNDSNGHAVGDEVLKYVAKLFQSCCRPGSPDMAFRYGGEEFCMLFEDTEPAEAMAVIENFRKMVEEGSLIHQDQELKVTVSIGMSVSLFDSMNHKEFFERADESLYECKHNGRNQVRIYANGLKMRFGPNIAENLKIAYQTLDIPFVQVEVEQAEPQMQSEYSPSESSVTVEILPDILPENL